MPKITPLPYKKLIKVFELDGFRIVRKPHIVNAIIALAVCSRFSASW